jgi:pyrroline-5-carboxylate reductase
MSRVVFLGGGRITSAMLAGLRLCKTRLQLIVHDRNPARLRDIKIRYAVAVEADLQRAVRQADMLIVAVRPGSVRALLGAVKNAIGRVDRPPLRRPLLAVSLAAGVPLNSLRKATGPQLGWGRAMPSPLCRGGRGLTAVTFSRSLPTADREHVHNLFAAFGQVVEIPERKFDALTVTFSPSYGYHALATLAQTAQAAGLDRKTALLASAHALADGIVAWRDGELSLEALLEEAATPGGIAAATMAAMDASGYKRAVLRGVAAGLQRARKNASK